MYVIVFGVEDLGALCCVVFLVYRYLGRGFEFVTLMDDFV